MAESSYPFNNPAGSGGSSTVSQSSWTLLARQWFSTGVVKGGLGSDLAVTAPGGVMSVNVASGQAIIQGFFYQSDATIAQAIAAADPSLPRIDSVIIRLDLTNKRIFCTALTGTPNASPVAPTLTQNSTTWEIEIARVAVAAAATQIVSANLTDKRTYGGGVRPEGVGNASGNIPLSNGTVCTNLNADKLDGIDSTGLAQVGTHNTISPLKISAGTTLPGTLDSREIFILLA